MLMCSGEIVEKAGQLDGPVDPPADDLRADASFADQQALADEFGDCPPGGGSGQAAPLGERDLVAQLTSRRQLTGGDRSLELPGQLLVQGNSAGPVECAGFDPDRGAIVLAGWALRGNDGHEPIQARLGQVSPGRQRMSPATQHCGAPGPGRLSVSAPFSKLRVPSSVCRVLSRTG